MTMPHVNEPRLNQLLLQRARNNPLHTPLQLLRALACQLLEEKDERDQRIFTLRQLAGGVATTATTEAPATDKQEARIKDLSAKNKQLQQRLDALLSGLAGAVKTASDIQPKTPPAKGKKPHGDA